MLEIEKVGQLKIKIVERTGDKISELLHKSNAWSNLDCERDDCWVCDSTGENEKFGKCKERSIIYETYCETCGLKGENGKEYERIIEESVVNNEKSRKREREKKM